MEGLIEWVYKGLARVVDYASYFWDRAILAPWNIQVHEINTTIVNAIPKEEKEYLSTDFVNSLGEDSFMYATYYVNTLDLGGGYPPHQLVLRRNAPIILLQNLNP